MSTGRHFMSTCRHTHHNYMRLCCTPHVFIFVPITKHNSGS